MFRERMQAILDRVESGRLIALVDSDGIPIEIVEGGASGNGTPLDGELLSAELVAQIRSLTASYRELSDGRFRLYSFATDALTFMVGSVSDDYFLLLVLDGASTSHGRARFELRRSQLAFEGDLF